MRRGETEWLLYFAMYARIVHEFTTRNLSFETDALLAFHGLGGAITRLNDVTFYFGMPSDAIDIARLWINLGSGARRVYQDAHETPSWLWAAWTGQSIYNLVDLSRLDHYEMNSYVRNYHVIDQGQSVELDRKLNRFCARPTTHADGEASSYFKARQGSSEPSVDLKEASKWPDDCLHFWAEESTMGEFYFERWQALYVIYRKTSGRRCGIFALPQSFHDSNLMLSLTDPGNSLILMSESQRILAHRSFGARVKHTEPTIRFTSLQPSWLDFDYPAFYYDEETVHESWMFNVLLVKRTGAFVERIAFGQVHMLAWLETQRIRRYIRML
jgi:hypothetical protein